MKKTWKLLELRSLPITEAEMPYYGYGDYRKSEIVELGSIEAPTERKAQNLFKKMFPYKGLSFSKSSPVCPFWLEEVKQN